MSSKKRILVLCTGNSCRSQMAEGFLNQYHDIEAFSAGTNPGPRVHPLAVQVMEEAGIDLSDNKPKHVKQFLDQSFDVVLTVCDAAKETCPVFIGNVGKRLHESFEDPDGQPVEKFREVRDKIGEFVNSIVNNK